MSARVQAAVTALQRFGVADRAQARWMLELLAVSAGWSAGARVTFGQWLRGEVPLSPDQVDLVVARFPVSNGLGHHRCQACRTEIAPAGWRHLNPDILDDHDAQPGVRSRSGPWVRFSPGWCSCSCSVWPRSRRRRCRQPDRVA